MSFKGDVVLPNNTYIVPNNPNGTLYLGRTGQSVIVQGLSNASMPVNLTVTGTSSLNGAVTANSSLAVNGLISSSTGISTSGNALCNNLTCSSNLTVGIDARVNGTLYCNNLVQSNANKVVTWTYTGNVENTLTNANASVPSDAKLMQVTVIGAGGGGGGGGLTIPNNNTISGQWVQFDLGSARTLGSYYLQSLNQNSMTAWIIAGSNDTSNWTIIDQVSGANIYGGYTRLVPAPNNSIAYRYMRWICLATTDFNYIFQHNAIWYDNNGNGLSSVNTILSSAPGDIIPGDNSSTIVIDGSSYNWVNTGNYSSGTYSGTSVTYILDLFNVLGGVGGGGGSGSIINLPVVAIDPSKPYVFRMKAGAGGNGGLNGSDGLDGEASLFTFFQSNSNSSLVNNKITIAGGAGGKGGLTNNGAGHGGNGGGANNGGTNGSYSSSAINYGGGGASFDDGVAHNGNGGNGFVNGMSGLEGSGGAVGGDKGSSIVGSQVGVSGGGGGIGGGNGACNGPLLFIAAKNGLDSTGAGGGGGSGYLEYSAGGKGGNGAIIITFIC